MHSPSDAKNGNRSLQYPHPKIPEAMFPWFLPSPGLLKNVSGGSDD